MDGIINVYKPIGITSFDVVRQLRKIANTKKIGHTGTLDPLACGVLPICIGKATKLVDYIMAGSKIYKAKMKLGVVTDTYDKEGKVLENKPIQFSENDVVNVIKSFVGDIKQVPPMYSAIKVKGKKLYELARQGIEIERQARDISIYYINILEVSLPYVEFEVKCSKGTYIRSLCYDIGEKLGCGAAMWGLERIASGSFEKSSSILLENLKSENILEKLISMDKALDNYEKIIVNDKCRRLLINGVQVKDKLLLEGVEKNILYRVYDAKQEFLGLAKRENNGLKMEKLLI